MRSAISALFVLWLQSALAANVTCPPPEAVKPCYCSVSDNAKSLACIVNDVDEVSATFRDFSRSEYDKEFAYAYLQVRTGPTIPADVFSEVTFESITIKGPKLSTIDKNAFHSSKNRVKNLRLEDFVVNDATYALVAELSRLQQLTFFRTPMKRVLSEAFVNTTLDHLQLISYHDVDVETIESRAWAAVPNLLMIAFYSLKSSSLVNIESYAFANNHNSDKPIVVLFENLTDASLNQIAPDAFLGTSRPAILYFSSPQVTYLPKDPFFAYFISRQNNIVYWDSAVPSLACDCNLAWLYQYRSDEEAFLQSKFQGKPLTCADGKVFWDLPADHFKDCLN